MFRASLERVMNFCRRTAARERLQTHPDRRAALFKRHMGSDKRFTLGDKEFCAEEVSSWCCVH